MTDFIFKIGLKQEEWETFGNDIPKKQVRSFQKVSKNAFPGLNFGKRTR
jgi:hypothetical protein